MVEPARLRESLMVLRRQRQTVPGCHLIRQERIQTPPHDQLMRRVCTRLDKGRVSFLRGEW